MDNHTAELAAKIDLLLSRDDEIAVLEDGPLTGTELRARALSIVQEIAGATVDEDGIIAIKSTSSRVVFSVVTAALRVGRPFVVCDPEASAEESQTLLEHCSPAVLITDKTLDPAKDGTEMFVLSASEITLTPDLGKFPPISEQSAAMLVYTSGTLSMPKTVVLSQKNIVSQLRIFAEAYRFNEASVLYNILPLHHVDGLVRGPMSCLWFGAKLIRNRQFSVSEARSVLDDLRGHRVSHLISVPAMLRVLERVWRGQNDIIGGPDFKFVLSSADYLEAHAWERFESEFGVPIVNAYGLSEVVCDALFAGPDEASRVPGTIGRPVGVTCNLLGPEGRVVSDGEIGELAISGPTILEKYLNNPEETSAARKDGCFFTGDLALKRPDGLYEYKGRKKNVVVVAGVTIYPEGVAEALTTIEGVAEAYAFGINDNDSEALVAAICAEEGVTLNFDDVWIACRTILSPERQPSQLVIADELPRRASGKVDRSAIVRLLEAQSKDVSATVSTSEQSLDGRVLAIASDCFNQPTENLSRESNPFNTVGWDSMAHMQLIEMLEEEFDFVMGPEDITNLMSLGDAIDIVERELGD